MEELEQKAQKLSELLQALIRSGGFNLTYNIACNGQVQPGTPADVSVGVEVQPGIPADVSAAVEAETAGAPSFAAAKGGNEPTPTPTPTTDEQPATTNPPQPEITVQFSGPDVSLLLARNGELLFALEHIAAKALRYEHEEHDRISFDADNYKLLRHQEILMAAEVAVDRVQRTGMPFHFAPMSSRERRILHMALAPSGLYTASDGEGPRRHVVLYPEGEKPAAQPSTADRAAAIRTRFRRR